MDWQEALLKSRFSHDQVRRYRAIIHWFLGGCHRQRPALSPNRKSANYFYATKVAEKQPPSRQKQQWKEALGWYLALVDPKDPPKPGQVRSDQDWETLFVQTLRLKQLAYRTEQTYLGWLKRFERFCQGQDLRRVSDAEIQRFLSDLAMKGRVRASTQNPAFNALLFLYREVFGGRVWNGVAAGGVGAEISPGRHGMDLAVGVS